MGNLLLQVFYRLFLGPPVFKSTEFWWSLQIGCFTLVAWHGLISFLGAETYEANFQECRLNWYEYCHLLLNGSGLTLLNCFLWSWNFFHYNAKSYILDFQLKCHISQTGLIMPIRDLKFFFAIWIRAISLRAITKPFWYIGSEPNFKQIMHCH